MQYQSSTCKFSGFCSGVAKDSNILWYDTATLSNHILTLPDSLQSDTLCLYTVTFPPTPGILLGHVIAWKWWQSVALKCWDSVTQSWSITSQKNRILKMLKNFFRMAGDWPLPALNLQKHLPMNTAKFDTYTVKISGLMRKWDITFHQKLKYISMYNLSCLNSVRTQVWVFSSVAV